jgi:hypothetical protein
VGGGIAAFCTGNYSGDCPTATQRKALGPESITTRPIFNFGGGAGIRTPKNSVQASQFPVSLHPHMVLPAGLEPAIRA